MFNDPVLTHFNQWGPVLFFVILYGLLIAFTPFYKKSQWKPGGAYFAFVVAFAIEMHGIPFSMYAIAAVTGKYLPDGFLWGHTLNQYIGHGGMYASIVVALIALTMVYLGWRDIYRNYWSKEEGTGRLVTSGIYGYIRHPQYTGFLLASLAMMLEWATLALLLMFPAMVYIYYRLARREERDMEQQFGGEYLAYKARTGMFLPRWSALFSPKASLRAQQ